MTSRNSAWLPLVLSACIASAAADARKVEVMAVGDTLNVVQHFTKQGNVDSVLTTVTSPRTPTTSKWSVNSPATVTIIPAPALVAGEVLSGQSCVMGMVKGKPTASACRPWTYTRPGVTNDSTIVAYGIMGDPKLYVNNAAGKGTWAPVSGTTRFCMSFIFKDGKVGMRSMERADTVCARYYATTVGQLQRLQRVAYVGGAWTVAPASTYRQGVLDNICLIGSDGSRDTTAACRVQSGSLRARDVERAS